MPLLLGAFIVCAQETPPKIAGDWRGTLKAGGGELRLVLHIEQSATGQLTVRMDSVDQGAGAMGMPASSAKLEGRRLTLEFARIGGTFTGELSTDDRSAENSAISGTWSQGQGALPLTFTRGTFEPPADTSTTVEPLVGIWEGAIEAEGAKLRCRVTLRKSGDKIVGSFDSIDQGANGMPLSGLLLKGSAFHFDLKVVGGSYDGTVNEGRTSIAGTWKQGGGSVPLTLVKVEKPTAIVRPQEPKAPFPYRAEDVKYGNAKAPGVELAGTLTMPEGQGPFPAVILISGSGPQNRDEELMGHKPFLVLADYLTRKGLAVLRFDDRGTAKSTGDFSKATGEDFATDVEAGIAYLKSRREIAAKKIGLLGHSEGGMIAPMVAARSTDVAFLVLIAAPGEPIPDLLRAQLRLIMKAQGAADEAIEKAAAQQNATIEAALSGDGPGASPWMRYFLQYDPRPVLEKVKVPVLAVNGGKDLQVPPSTNLTGVRAALTKGGNTRVKAVELPGLNHLLQKAETGGVAEYGAIEETMNPAALELIGEWLVATSEVRI
jgi:pimeloyl-ACP methyl ester carboxylesterase